MQVNGDRNPAGCSQGRPTKRVKTSMNSSHAVQPQPQAVALHTPSQEQPQQVEPQQVQPQQSHHFSAGPGTSYPHATAEIAAPGPVNQTEQAINLPVNNLNDDGFLPDHQPSELVNNNVAPSQPVESNKPTPDALANMQYNLLFGPVLKQPDTPSQSQGSSSSQAVEPPNLDSVLDSSLFEDSPMEITYQSQEQPLQQEEVQQAIQEQQAFEVASTQQPMGDGDLFEDGNLEHVDLEQELLASLGPLMEFNAQN